MATKRQPTPSWYLNWKTMAIPVKANPAAREQRYTFSLVHRPCAEKGIPATFKAPRSCSVCMKAPLPDEVVKAYFTGESAFVLLTKDELEQLESAKSKVMDVERFVPWREVDPLWCGPSAYLTPVDTPTSKGYVALKQALETTERAAIVKYVRSDHDRVGIVRPYNDCLILHEAFMPADVAVYENKALITVPMLEPSKAEQDLAVKLVLADAGDFDLSGYADGFRQRVGELIQAKVEGRVKTLPTAAAAPPAVPANDLMAQLTAALEVVHGQPAKAKAEKKKSKRGKAA